MLDTALLKETDQRDCVKQELNHVSLFGNLLRAVLRILSTSHTEVIQSLGLQVYCALSCHIQLWCSFA